MNEYFHDIHSLTDLEMVIFETLFNESDYHIEDILDIIFEKKYIIYEVSDLEELGEKLLEEEEENIPEWILNYINLVQYAQDQIKNNEFYELEGVGYVVLTT